MHMCIVQSKKENTSNKTIVAAVATAATAAAAMAAKYKYSPSCKKIKWLIVIGFCFLFLSFSHSGFWWNKKKRTWHKTANSARQPNTQHNTTHIAQHNTKRISLCGSQFTYASEWNQPIRVHCVVPTVCRWNFQISSKCKIFSTVVDSEMEFRGKVNYIMWYTESNNTKHFCFKSNALLAEESLVQLFVECLNCLKDTVLFWNDRSVEQRPVQFSSIQTGNTWHFYSQRIICQHQSIRKKEMKSFPYNMQLATNFIDFFFVSSCKFCFVLFTFPIYGLDFWNEKCTFCIQF